MDVGHASILLDQGTQQVGSAVHVAIYALRDPEALTVRYIGKASDPVKRLRQHLEPGQLNRYRSKKNSWLKALALRGQRPLLEIVDEVPAEDADAAERYWIAWYLSEGAPLTNGTGGGDGGAVTDPDARARIAAAHLGVTRTAETRELMSASAKKRCEDEKERARLRSISNRKPPTSMGEENPRAKLSDAQVRQLRELAAAGEDLRSLAAEYGITAASVTQIVTGKSRVAAGGPTREAKPRSVLSDEDVVEIRRLTAGGASQADLAQRYDVHPSHISKITSCQRRRLDKQ